MPEACQACSCVPYQNLCCCPAQFGISVMQPMCQTLPNGSVVINPCYDSVSNISTWTYKFFTDCVPGNTVSAISNFLIPVCSTIQQGSITVEERIDGCGVFTPVAFTLSTMDGNFGTAPSGFQWLKVENPTPPSTIQRYGKGVCVEYRIRIVGNFTNAVQPIRVKAGTNLIVFNCEPDTCFVVPGCPNPGKLAVTKICSATVANNMASINYQVTVTNTGGQTLTNVQYSDTINYNAAQLTLGTPMIVPPSPLSVTVNVPGMITISGTIPSISANGGTFTAVYTVPVTSVLTPGVLNVNNTVTVSATGTTASASCTASISAVRVSASKCCTPIVGGNGVAFNVTISSVGASPETQIRVIDQLIIPQGVTVQFTSFGGCTATFPNGTPVPTGMDVTNTTITITCDNVTVPANGGSITLPIQFNVVSTTAFGGTLAITNTLQQVAGLNPNQIFLPPVNVPANASVSITGTVTCNNLCPTM